MVDLLASLNLFLKDNSAERERVEAAVVLLARGDGVRLRQQASLAELDWRDVLVSAGLADGGWAQRLDALLGPSR